MIQLAMKQTANRLAIIKCLTEPNYDCGGLPPYSADSIHHMLEGNFEWYGAKKPVSISQINRTLRDLFSAGLIVKESRIDEPLESGLPSRVNYWQMAEAVGRNELLTKVQNACRTASEAHGTFLFCTTSLFNMPFNAKQKQAIVGELKVLMQQTHPDKVPGFEDEFIQLQQALTYVRSNINLLKTPKARLSVA